MMNAGRWTSLAYPLRLTRVPLTARSLPATRPSGAS